MALIKCPQCGGKLNTEKVCNNCGTNVSKLDETLCKGCNGILEKCPECNNPISSDTEICDQCGYKIGVIKNKICKCCDKKKENELQKDEEYQIVNNDKKSNQKKRRKLLFVIPCAILLVVLFFIVYTQVHIYADATCTEPKTCIICRRTEGYKLYHQWVRECEKVETCERCGLEKGEPIEHSWQEATCETPKTCFRCQKTEGKALGHQGKWKTETEATILSAGYEYEICERCHKTLDSYESEKKKPEVEGDHFNFGAGEFIVYLNDYLNSMSLNADVEVDVMGTSIVDNKSNGGVAFSVPVSVNNEKIKMLISENQEGYTDGMFIQAGSGGTSLMIFAVAGASLTNSRPYEFLMDLSNDNDQKGMIFYERNKIRFAEMPFDDSYVLSITPIAY